MFAYVFRRLLHTIVVILGVSLLTFTAVELAPGDVIDSLAPPESFTTEEAKEKLREELGLNDAAPVRFVKWLGRAIQGDLGYSLTSRQPVTDVIGGRLPATLLLMGFALVFSTILGVSLGVFAARHQNTWLDVVSTMFSFLWLSIPSFFLGLGLIYLLSVKSGILPSSGMSSHNATNIAWDRASHLILPGITLGMDLTAALIRFVRSSMIEVMKEDYLRTARAKGLNERQTLFGHAFRNAMIPIVTVIAFRIPVLIGGAVIIETIFQWPGLGTLTLTAAKAKDYPIIMGIGLTLTLVAVLSNLIADIAYGLIDPRIRIS